MNITSTGLPSSRPGEKRHCDRASSAAPLSSGIGEYIVPVLLCLAENTVSLQFEGASVLPARAQLVYDIRSVGGTGTAIFTINGTKAGVLPPAASVPGAIGQEWVHRSMDIDVSLVRFGTNNVRIDLQGTVQLDRMHVELSYPTPPPTRTRAVGK